MKRIGEWDQTFTGLRVYPMDQRVAEVDIEDIAHALAMLCRYGGNVSHFYSVAEHSVLVSRFVPREFALEGLLHDACEAGGADLPRWLKNVTAIRDTVRAIEAQRTRVVYEALGVQSTPVSAAAVDLVDKQIVADEIAALKTDPSMYSRRYVGVDPVGADIVGYSPERAKVVFLMRYYELTHGA